MPGNDAYQHDVLVIGGGGAGLRAAIAAVEESGRLSIAVLSKVYPMRSHTVSAEGGTAAVMRENDSLDTHAKDTIFGSDFLADQDVVEAFVKEAPGEVIQLEHWGCPWSRDPDGRVSVRPFGGMTVNRTLYAADKTGFHMLHALFQTSLKYDRIVRYDEWFATSLLVEDGRVCGVAALNVHDGTVRAITAKAVIICTGGAGRIFQFTTNAAIKTGDGMALAYRAGAPLKDMEFMQYHPTGLPGTGILITEASRGEGGHLKNKDGYPVSSGLRAGSPDRQAGTPQDGAGAPRYPVPLPHPGAPEGADLRGSLRALRPPGPPAPRREADRQESPLRARAGEELRGDRSRLRADPRPPGDPLHHGRDFDRHRRQDAVGRPVRGRGGGVRLHQRRQPARLQLADRAARVRRSRRPGGRPARAGAAGRQLESRCATGERRTEASRYAVPESRRARADRRHPGRDAEGHGGRLRHLPRKGDDGADLRHLAPAPRAIRPHRPDGPRRGLQHRADRGAGARVHAGRGRGGRPLGAGARGVEGSAYPHRLPQARRRALSQALARLPDARRPAHRVPAGHDHPVAPEERKY